MERRCAEEEKRQDLSHLDQASSITEQLAASSSSEHLDLSSIIEELGSPPFVSSRCPVQRTHFLTTAPPPHILFTCYPLLPPPTSEKARAPALCPPQSSHRLTFITSSPRHDITGPVPFWSSSLHHPLSMLLRLYAQLQRSVLSSNNHQVQLSENMLVIRPDHI